MLSLLLLSLAGAGAQAPLPDVVVFCLDDVATADVDALPTPSLDALAARGVSFRRAYAHPWCAPTRSSLLFGWWAGRGHGDSCEPPDERTVSHGRSSLPKLFAGAGYATTLVGKWHLGTNTLGAPWQLTPHLHGFHHWRAGVASSVAGCFDPGSERVDDGVISTDETHRTIQQRDAFLEEYRAAKRAGLPFFGLLAFTDAHKPWKIPPPEILPSGYRPAVPITKRVRFEAEVLALDFVIGEIVAELAPGTWIFVFGDNGTPEDVSPDPQRAKTTVFERGVRVPFVCAGPGVVPAEREDLVHVVDLFPTLAELLGLPPPPGLDGTSFAPVLAGGDFARPWTFVHNPERGERAVIEARWKLREADGVTELYDLEAGETALPAEGPNAERLRARLATLP